MREAAPGQGKWGCMIVLHMLLVLYSVSGVCSKLVVQYPLLSMRFCGYVVLFFLSLSLYAVGWQQIIKYMPLTMAYANKAVTVVWGMIWGKCIFQEPITIGKMAGAVLVMIGVVFYAIADGGAGND